MTISIGAVGMLTISTVTEIVGCLYGKVISISTQVLYKTSERIVG